jgi:archaeosine-15-forming tRNA-guanine transglycosylase
MSYRGDLSAERPVESRVAMTDDIDPHRGVGVDIFFAGFVVDHTPLAAYDGYLVISEPGAHVGEGVPD